ncbi:hypothetical protein [Labilithrix luteola]|uniref:hypothetical protein n=1 Tax=Labilithrix luteola TaxID=1391654 RepID=UPI0011BACC5D|nr:hypothetical protein [Labilithrix luteola]
MTLRLRQGRFVQILVSDPWEFGTACGVGPFDAVVEGIQQGRLVLRLRQGLDYGGTIFRVVAVSRYKDSIEEAFEATNDVAANLVLIHGPPRETDKLEDVVRMSGALALGSVHLAPASE